MEREIHQEKTAKLQLFHGTQHQSSGKSRRPSLHTQHTDLHLHTYPDPGLGFLEVIGVLEMIVNGLG